MPGKSAVHAGAKEEKMRREVAVESTAEAYLEMLAARGIDYFFANGGTDFGPIVEAYAKRMASELPVPKPVTVQRSLAEYGLGAGVSGRWRLWRTRGGPGRGASGFRTGVARRT